MNLTTVLLAAIMTLPAARVVNAQMPAADDSLLFFSIRQGATYLQQVMIGSAERMSDEDYAFRPAPDVRTFAALIGHVADSNYLFCSIMKGETNPAPAVEKTKTTKAELQAALVESFTYCDPVLLAMSGPRGREIVRFQGSSLPARAVMNYRSYHGLLHYGNVITYMRLRGKVPPSTEP